MSAQQSVNIPGTFSRCMSGHYYACTRGDEECPHCQILESTRQRWQEAQARLAVIQAKLEELTGEEMGILDNITHLHELLLHAERQTHRLRSELAEAKQAGTPYAKQLHDLNTLMEWNRRLRESIDWEKTPHKAWLEETEPSPSGKMQWRCLLCGRVTAGAERECRTLAMVDAVPSCQKPEFKR